jgi:hypothetical protein
MEYRMAPRPYTSEAVEMSAVCALAISGDMYGTVPTIPADDIATEISPAE